MVSREDLKSPRFLVPAGLVALGGLLVLLLLAVSCPGEKTRLRQRIQKLEREKTAAETSATRWKAESKAKDQYLKSITMLLNDVASRIDQIEQDQKGLAALTVQKGGDSLRIVKNPSIPQALDRIDEQLDKNREQIGQLESLAAAESSENQNLKAVVDRLKRQNEGLDQQLQTLRRSLGVMSKKVKTLEAKVGQLETEVGERNEVIEEKDRTIGEKEAQLAERSRQIESAEAEKWRRNYVVDTRKELCRLSIIAPCGLFKSVRSSRLADGHVGAFEACGEKCHMVDARTLSEILLGKIRGDIEILPQRSAGSYVVEKRNGETYLLVRDLDEFWNSQYLAIIVER